MPIIPQVGRRSLKLRLLIAVLYVVLALGAVTMVYPFLLMVATSFTSDVDANDYAIIPRFIRDDGALFTKLAVEKYAGDLDLLNGDYRSEFAKPQDVRPPTGATPEHEAEAREWTAFVAALPPEMKRTVFGTYAGVPSRLQWRYHEWLRARYPTVEALNKAYVEENERFTDVQLPFERHLTREWAPPETAKWRDWAEFRRTLPPMYFEATLVEPLYRRFLKDRYDTLEALNREWGTRHARFEEITLAETRPVGAEGAAWEAFARSRLPFAYLRVDKSAQPAYAAFLRARYRDPQLLAKRYGLPIGDPSAVSLPKTLPAAGPVLTDWMRFIAEAVPASALRADTPETRWRDSRRGRSGDSGDRGHGNTKTKRLRDGEPDPNHPATVSPARLTTRRPGDPNAFPPVHLADWLSVRAEAGLHRRHFLTRNYRIVADYVLVHGRALVNTVIYCGLAILTALIVNPLCAFALSRYNLRHTDKILLFLLATMAFPAEVAMIPNFLLLKEFHMLNTFWALILPSAASGFSIFLLKGFFDSLPRELYEAAVLDGASEPRMFWTITLPLSKPIFAVIALQSFTAAYGAFMFALLVCQDPEMWTLMVWLYQLQTWAPKSILLAGLTLASIPTLLLFLTCQNVIMRGIILPSER
jgi:ABC-type glycerol-3-phosphate transport system permease component